MKALKRLYHKKELEKFTKEDLDWLCLRIWKMKEAPDSREEVIRVIRKRQKRYRVKKGLTWRTLTNPSYYRI